MIYMDNDDIDDDNDLAEVSPFNLFSVCQPFQGVQALVVGAVSVESKVVHVKNESTRICTSQFGCQ